jgi:hypothetical protein
MPVSDLEVQELQTMFAALPADHECGFELAGLSIVEIIALTIEEARVHGWPVTDHLELLVRASALDREDIREARDVLRSLHYDADITALLTALARKAPPRLPPVIRRQCTSAVAVIARTPAERQKMAARVT